MRYLLDTNVISEFRRRQPDPRVVGWLNGVDPETVYLSVLAVGELKKGIEKLAGEERKQALQTWLDNDLLVRFDRRLVSLDVRVLLVWGALAARLEMAGQAMPVMDSLIAATALAGDFILVTRNEADFAAAGVKLLNPWR